jgi:hypothetical protein
MIPVAEAESETWKSVTKNPGYEVSDLGGLRSYWIRDGKRRNDGVRAWREDPIPVGGYPWPKGYLMARLSREGGKPQWRMIHTIVLEAFVGPRPVGAEACHADGNPANNRLDNLRWASRSENQKDTLRHGRHRQARMTEPDIRDIWERLRNGDPQNVIARDYRTCQAVISHIRHGRSWSHITGGLPPLVRGADTVATPGGV